MSNVTAAEVQESAYRGWTVPVHVEIGARQVVLTQPEMECLLDKAETIALGDCGCRRDAVVCDHPLEVCLAVDEEAWEQIRT
ncbi:MAG: hypothetical protein AB1778_04685 [Candidatus Bipolaricaulota bacterium]